jgi:hypothetical protein
MATVHIWTRAALSRLLVRLVLLLGLADDSRGPTTLAGSFTGPLESSKTAFLILLAAGMS